MVALSQQGDRRLLGYSSVGQIGLILAVIGQRDILGENYQLVAGGLILTHATAKAGLFWLSQLVQGRRLVDWASLRSSPIALLAFATFIAMLVGLPPLPVFLCEVGSGSCSCCSEPLAASGPDPHRDADRSRLHVPLVRLWPQA
ncbi:proton-conducting transporter membrane subunit [uncultured Cohaesibacter sp.]|uniref:proton-conducting transporter transmembrane domain-containing protein n=1 Tax=uncultured Cohaesibacter sp. TaxID=1002546 RepID=UPI0037488F4E